jgi:hypothetical protein
MKNHLGAVALSIACLLPACTGTTTEDADVETTDRVIEPAWSGSIFRFANLTFSSWTFYDSNGQPIFSGCSGTSVRFTVKNTGNVTSPETDATVFGSTSSGGYSVAAWLPSLAPGASTTLSLPYSPHTTARVVVDSRNDVVESNETDNLLPICPG